ncbi:hypothetical protein G6F57_014139 [Rhizopus arrhizus]|nr:hypothetical protein G6F57_014139 [Rhizopus arrhizus]
MKELHASQRRHVQDVQRQHAAGVADLSPDLLRPASRGRSQVDHDHVRLQQPVTFEQFFELVGSARAHAFGLRLLHEGVGEVFLEPALAAFAAGCH